MAKLTSDAERCKGCGLCIDACPQKIVKLSKGFNYKGYPVAECDNIEKCTACASCARMCPDAVIVVER